MHDGRPAEEIAQVYIFIPCLQQELFAQHDRQLVVFLTASRRSFVQASSEPHESRPLVQLVITGNHRRLSTTPPISCPVHLPDMHKGCSVLM